MRKEKSRVWELFLVFLKIGAFTFGGGYAMIPLIQREMVDNKKWISEKDILDIIAISESTPGPIAVNAATFVGYHVAGVAGAAAATFGVVLPAFCIIACLATILPKLERLRVVQYAFWGIRVGVLALLLRALLTMYHSCQKTVFAVCIMFAAFACVAMLQMNTIVVLIGCAVAGIVLTMAKEGVQK